MDPFSSLGRILIIFGLFIVLLGVLISLISSISGKFFRLPGDIYYEKDGFKFYFPITTSIILSIILTLVLNLIFLLINKK